MEIEVLNNNQYYEDIVLPLLGALAFYIIWVVLTFVYKVLQIMGRYCEVGIRIIDKFLAAHLTFYQILAWIFFLGAIAFLGY